jgi:hypothetical protein
MPRTCTVCTRAERAEIDAALLDGQPFRDIAGRFGTSRSALLRHKKADLPATLVKAKQAQEEVRAETLFERLRAVNRETVEILREARESSSPSIALAAINRVERQLELEARLLGQLNEATRVAVGVNVNSAKPKFDFSGWSDEQLDARIRQLADETRQPCP